LVPYTDEVRLPQLDDRPTSTREVDRNRSTHSDSCDGGQVGPAESEPAAARSAATGETAVNEDPEFRARPTGPTVRRGQEIDVHAMPVDGGFGMAMLR
jgi:hypothetical protein